MALEDRKIKDWAQPITSLADKPQMAAAMLKAAFDSNANEIRPAINGMIDDLQAAEAAGQLGFTATAGVQAGTVQAAIESVQQQVVDTALGEVPDGSIGRDKLTAALQGELGQMQRDLQEEKEQREQGDQTLQGQVDANLTDLQSQINTKAEVVIGTYQGNNALNRTINLGFTPKAVILTDGRGSMVDSSSYIYGGFAVQGYASRGLTITTGGFIVSFDGPAKIYTNYSDVSSIYRYIAFK